MKVLIGLFLFLFIVELSLVIAGINGLFHSKTNIIIEFIVAFLMLVAGIVSYKRYRRMNKLFEDIEDEELRMTALIQSMPDFVCFKDGKGRWIKTNDFGKELYGLQDKQYIGKTDRELGLVSPFFKDAFEYCMASDEDTWQKAKTVRAEEAFFIPSGELKTFDVIKVPNFYEDGSRKALITIGRDISQQKLAEEKLVKQEKLAVAGELAAGIAHEIKNPLTSIKGFVQLLRENAPLSHQNVSIMSSEIDRIQSIVEELLALSKPQTRLEESFSIHSAIEYVVNIMKHQAYDKKVELFFEQSDDSSEVLGDRNQLIQVFINLLKNGIEAMENGGQIRIWTVTRNGSIRIGIQDQGTGISEADLQKLGEPFFTTKEKGMGLGLAICQKIIHEHKGQMKFQSKLNEGTMIFIDLPVFTK